MRIKHFLTMALLAAVAMVNAQEMPPTWKNLNLN